MTRIPTAEVVSARVQSLYDDVGWKESDGITVDAQTYEDLRPVARDYLTRCRLRVARHLPKTGDRLMDMASGPLQYPEYLEYSAGFKTRVCVDLSQRALDMAQAKLGDRGEYLCGDFLEMELGAGSVDAVVSLHTIYHIHASKQAAAVRKLLDVTRANGVVVIVYTNPDNIVSAVSSLVRRIAGRKVINDATDWDHIYFEPQPLRWWQQFGDTAQVEILPWRSLSTSVMRALIPDNRIGRAMLSGLFALEERFPGAAVKLGRYPMIVLRKH